MTKEAAPQDTKIHRKLTIEEILSRFPDKAQRLSQEITNAGLHCVGCHAATWETLEAGMLGHGMGEDKIEHLVGRLNALLEEKADMTTITLTERAAKQFMLLAAEENKIGFGVRLGERMAGCSGLEYELEFSEKADPELDEVFESHGIQIHVRKKILPHMKGVNIDYIDSLRGGGVKITNPNVRSSCGCGSSYNY